MLPNINLDDELFSEISENARKLITKYSPGWTDFNAHDPGITFIELFAWLKEMQQYRMNRIDMSSRLKFLKMLGIKPHHRKPAEAFVEVSGCEEDTVLLRSSSFSAGNIQFETEAEVFVSCAKIISGYSQTGDKTIWFADNALASGMNMHFYIFGKEPQIDSAFYICIDRPVPAGKTVSLYIDIFADYEISRNPVSDGFLPLAEIKWQYRSAEGWTDVSRLEDETHAFITSGGVKMTIDGEMLKEAGADGGYLLRAVITDGMYDVPPVLKGIIFNAVKVQQKQTRASYHDTICTGVDDMSKSVSYLGFTQKNRYFIKEQIDERDVWYEVGDEELNERLLGLNQKFVSLQKLRKLVLNSADEGFGQQDDAGGKGTVEVRTVSYDEEFGFHIELGTGDGFPYQEYLIEVENLMFSDFEIMVETEENKYIQWQKVDDFDQSSPEDLHYCFVEETGTVLFGDCEKGMAPEGRIIVIGCASSLDVGGNVKANTIDTIDDTRSGASVRNYLNASGGEKPESVDDCFRRYIRDSHGSQRAVTYEDYEYLVKSTPGLMIKNCKAVPASKMPRPDGSVEENCVNIVVQPYSTGRAMSLSGRYLENIYRRLDERQLICTKVNVLSPEYIGIVIFAEISVKSYYRNAEDEIRAVISEFFEKAAADFGKPVQYSEIYGIIDTLSCVAGINSLVVDAQGKGIRRSVNGDVILPQNGMAFLKEAEYVLTASE